MCGTMSIINNLINRFSTDLVSSNAKRLETYSFFIVKVFIDKNDYSIRLNFFFFTFEIGIEFIP